MVESEQDFSPQLGQAEGVTNVLERGALRVLRKPRLDGPDAIAFHALRTEIEITDQLSVADRPASETKHARSVA